MGNSEWVDGDASEFVKDFNLAGGEGGIRTHGTVTRTTVFETVPFDHSGTSPRRASLAAPAVERKPRNRALAPRRSGTGPQNPAGFSLTANRPSL